MNTVLNFVGLALLATWTVVAWRWNRRSDAAQRLADGRPPATFWSNRRDELRATGNTLKRVPVIVAPVLWWQWIQVCHRNCYDEDVLVDVEESGFRSARSFSWIGLALTFAVWWQDPGAWGTAWVWFAAASAWFLLGIVVTTLVGVACWRFSRVNSGRWPGQEPDSASARRKADRYFQRACRDARFAADGPQRPVSEQEALERDALGTRREQG